MGVFKRSHRLHRTPHYNSLRDVPDTRSRGEAGGEKQALAAAEVRVLDEWRAVNTAIYFHVEPAVLIDGVFFLRDTEEIEGMSSSDGVADGRGLVRWALSKVDLTGKEEQRALWRKLGTRMLDASATRAQFTLHFDRLFQHWSVLHGSDPTDRGSLADFYDQLLDTMPATPAASHIVSLRTWLAGRVVDFQAGGGSSLCGLLPGA